MAEMTDMRPVAVVLIISLLLAPSNANAQGPTSTPTPTITPTLTNNERFSLATIVPPAQCGTIFNPCGALPWTVPRYATVALPSPTLIDPLHAYGAAPTVTPYLSTATFTPTGTLPTATPYTELNLGPINTLSAGISDISNTMVVPPTLSIDASGAPQGIQEVTAELSTSVPNVFSTIRGVASVSQSRTLSVIGFLFIGLLFVFLVRFGTMFFPVLLNLIRFILQVIQAFKPF
jgi:hypothetical protein